jgi:hypothetical protein
MIFRQRPQSMSERTIPDALALDLQDLYLEAQPEPIPAESIRLKHESGEPPSPRLVILTGDPRRQPLMDGTAFIPVSVQYITSMDRVTPEEHQIAAGKIDTWWRSIRAEKRRATLSSRTYLHELMTTQPTGSISAREQITTIRGDLMVTLIAAV